MEDGKLYEIKRPLTKLRKTHPENNWPVKPIEEESCEFSFSQICEELSSHYILSREFSVLADMVVPWSFV